VGVVKEGGEPGAEGGWDLGDGKKTRVRQDGKPPADLRGGRGGKSLGGKKWYGLDVKTLGTVEQGGTVWDYHLGFC